MNQTITSRHFGTTPAQMRDVAKLAGVSISTVSHVVNNTRPVAEATRARVEQTMLQLNYYKNVSGRRLARGRSDTFGLIISDVENPFVAEMIKSFERAVVEIGFDVFLAPTNYDPAYATSAIRRIIENKVQGVAVMTSHLEPSLIDRLLANDIPVVTLDGVKPSRGRSNIRVDYSGGAKEAVEHLDRLGHKCIAFITGPEDRLSARRYKQAFIDALHDNHVEPSMCIEGDNTIEGGRAAMLALMREAPFPTAVICGNDLAALGALHALAEADVPVPDRISIVGGDDISFARYAIPALTTVRVPRDQLGKLAFEALHRLMRTKRRLSTEYVLETHLVVRGSTGAVAV